MSSEGENKGEGEFLKLEGDATQQQGGTENVSGNPTHQEGVEHIKEHSEAGEGQGASDSTSGIANDAGGVSSTAYVGSPVPEEQKGVMQSTVDTVKNYLGALSLGSGGAAAATSSSEEDKKEAGAEDAKGEDNTASSDSTSSSGGAMAGAAATASAAAAAVVGSSSSKNEGDREEKKEEVPATTSSDSASAERSSASESASQDTSMADTKPKDDAPKADKAGGDANKPSPGKQMENKDSIPTAGGEKLGEKHWGESKMVPDNPQSQAQETEKVSSAEGQPDASTRDNTAKNTGGAAPPSGEDNNDSGEGKQKFTDKIKDKLHIGKDKE